MALRQINARDIIVQVSDGLVSPTWLGIGGLRSIKPNPGEDEQVTETTTVDSDGDAESQVMQRGFSLTCEGRELEDNATGSRDPGQARVDALCAGVGEGSLGSIRFRTPASATWKVWAEARFSLGEQGGETNDKGAWVFTAVRSGHSSTAAVV